MRVEAPEIRVRDEWGADLPPTGPLELEAAEDVRFLLLHHTASPNAYEPADVPGLLASFYRTHTGPNGWPDIAYNFLVDRFGVIWEGRAGSIDGPVKGSATGGSQGFALLASFIGDHTTERPTDAAVEAMVALLAWLADRYGIDTTPGATTEFVSRGSNKWPAGTHVESATIAGHRDMSYTECPGDAGYQLVTEELPVLVTAARAAAEPTPTPEARPAPTPTTQPPASRHGEARATPSPPRSSVTAPSPQTDGTLMQPASPSPAPIEVTGADPEGRPTAGLLAATAAVVSGTAAATAAWLRRRARPTQWPREPFREPRDG